MKSVQVLMSTYNGDKFLREQLDSIFAQKDVDIRLLVRDDGSSDGTQAILREYEEQGALTYFAGKNIGYKRSFLRLLDNVPYADYYAFADQDDYWIDDKIITAIRVLEKEGNANKPLLYTSALQCTDESLNKTNLQDFPGLKLDLYSEFVRHRFAGCTYVFNNALKNVCKGTSKIDEFWYSHDGWVSLMCWAAGGKVIYDQTSHILFRRYGTNTSAAGAKHLARLKYEFQFLNKKKHMRSDVSKVILKYYERYLTSEAKGLFLLAANSDRRELRHQILIDDRFDCGLKQGNELFKICVYLGCL